MSKDENVKKTDEFLTIGCRLPHGLVAEVGYSIAAQGSAVVKGSSYREIQFNGTNTTMKPGDVALLVPEPGITKGVPADFWEAWCEGQGKTHPARLNNLIYVVRKDAPSADAQHEAGKSLRTGLEPLDPTKMPEGVSEAPVDGRPPIQVR